MLYINSNAYASRNLVDWVATAQQNYYTWPHYNSANLMGNYTPTWTATAGYSNLAYTPNLLVKLTTFSLSASLLSFTV